MKKIPSQLDKATAPHAAAGSEEDPIVEECLRDALGMFPGMLSGEDEEEHRRLLRAFILTHPAARALYDQIRYKRLQAQPNASSGPVAKDGALLDGEAEVLGDGTAGARR